MTVPSTRAAFIHEKTQVLRLSTMPVLWKKRHLPQSRLNGLGFRVYGYCFPGSIRVLRLLWIRDASSRPSLNAISDASLLKLKHDRSYTTSTTTVPVATVPSVVFPKFLLWTEQHTNWLPLESCPEHEPQDPAVDFRPCALITYHLNHFVRF